jgi:hypothetical protein
MLSKSNITRGSPVEMKMRYSLKPEKQSNLVSVRFVPLENILFHGNWPRFYPHISTFRV